MAQLDRPDLHAEIDLRFPDNITELITPPIVRAFLHNLVDSALLAVSDKIALSTALSLSGARALLATAPPSVQPGQLYAVTGNWNAIGTNTSTVYVVGLSNLAFHPEGILFLAGKYLKVKVDVLAGTVASASNSFADLLGVPDDNAALAAALTGKTSYSQARAAQLNRVAPAGTTIITLTSESPHDYGTAASGTFTIDPTDCVVGKEVYFAIGAGASAPLFNTAPAGQPYKMKGPGYRAGFGFSYSLRVCLDKIEIVILPD